MYVVRKQGKESAIQNFLTPNTRAKASLFSWEYAAAKVQEQ